MAPTKQKPAMYVGRSEEDSDVESSLAARRTGMLVWTVVSSLRECDCK